MTLGLVCQGPAAAGACAGVSGELEGHAMYIVYEWLAGGFLDCVGTGLLIFGAGAWWVCRGEWD